MEVRNARALPVTPISDDSMPPPLASGLIIINDEVSKPEDEQSVLTNATGDGLDKVAPSTPPRTPIHFPQVTLDSPSPATNSPSFAPNSLPRPSDDYIDTTIDTTITEDTTIESPDVLSPRLKRKVTSVDFVPVMVEPSDPSPEVTQLPQQLRPPTKTELKARAEKEKETLEAQRQKEKTNNAPMSNQSAQSKLRPKPRPKVTTNEEHAALDAPNKDSSDVGPLLPAGIKVRVMLENAPVENVVLPRRQRALTAEGRRQAAEIAEKEEKRRARFEKKKATSTQTTKSSQRSRR